MPRQKPQSLNVLFGTRIPAFESFTSGARFCVLPLRQLVSMGELGQALPVIKSDKFDRMLLNTSQLLQDWQDYFGTPKGGKLGLMNAIYQIGSIASFPFA